MAYFEPEKEKELGAEGQPVATGPEAGGGTLGGGATEGGAAAAAEPSAPSGGGPTPFVGIKQYLDANKPQSEKLAGNVGGYVNQLGQNVRDTLPTQTGLYNQAVDQNTVNLDQNLVEETKNNRARVANDATKLGQFQTMRDAQYKGPQDFKTSEFYKPTEDALKKAQTASDNTQTEQGQRTLINNYQQANSGRIGSAGSTNFDQMLLQSGGGREILGKAREGQKDLPGLVDTANQTAAQRAQQAAATTDATRNAIANTFGYGGTYGQREMETLLKDRAYNQVNQSKQDTSRLVSALQSGAPLSAQDLKTLGVTKSDYDGLLNQMAEIRKAQLTAGQGGSGGFAESGGFTGESYTPTAGFDLSKFTTPFNPETQINAQNVATADEYAQYEALNKLMGTQNSFVNQNQVGKANSDVIDLNLQGARDYLSQILSGIPVTPKKKEMSAASRARVMNTGENYDPSWDA